jgi:DNA adenine methylase
MPIIANFLRYPGSKRRFLRFFGNHIPKSHEIDGSYYEPFLGGGAVFFYVNPKKSILSDLNPNLVELYLGLYRVKACETDLEGKRMETS